MKGRSSDAESIGNVRQVKSLTRLVPPHPEGSPPLLNLLASLAPWGLYALLLLMPLTGAIAWFGRVEAAAVLHETGRLTLAALILAHALGALVEHFVIGNRVIRRMLRPVSRMEPRHGHRCSPLVKAKTSRASTRP